jgi:membrane fusion protein (multidrug efflux system)
MLDGLSRALGGQSAAFAIPVFIQWPSMVEKQDADNSELDHSAPAPRADEGVSVGRAPASVETATVAPANHRPGWKRLALGALAVVLLAAIWKFGIPWIELTLNTVSTDDAYVNGHVTFVAPRVSGQVVRVFVDDNNRVHKGDILVQLDKEPYEDDVAVKRAAVDTAKADLLAATATVRGLEAQARSQYWQLENAMEDVDNRVAQLRARVATVDKNNAALKLAQLEFARAEKLLPNETVSRQEYDRRQAVLSETQAEVAQATADVHQIRAALGLPAQPKSGDLAEVPADLDETFSSVRDTQAALIRTAAQLGVTHSFKQLPKQMLQQFENLNRGDTDKSLSELTANAPAIKQAQAKLEAANRDLVQAELNLRYCDIVAEIDGVVTRRNVNPGNDVRVGQSLMAIRSLREIWVDANFKETQLRDLRIGQAADLYVDMYGGRHVFKGRISGFTMGTGSTLALLPPENATGNFVKVVQRLPVRIDLEGYDPNDNTLFIGTSVVPYVYINKPATGPDAGKFLQANSPSAPSVSSPQSLIGHDK